MEADWSVEIGPDLPCIDASWPGFLDLRSSPHDIDALPEPAQHPALRVALLALNAPGSPVFTTKCDTWTLAASEIDPVEFDAAPADAGAGFASYIDVLDRDRTHFSSFAHCERCVRELASRLRTFPLRSARVDCVVRQAVFETANGYGITLYVAACGANATAAYTAWQSALAATVDATMAVAVTHTGE